MSVRQVADLRGEPLAQLSTRRWWFGTPPNGFPYAHRVVWGNQLHVWSLWVRLPGNRELEVHGRELTTRECSQHLAAVRERLNHPTPWGTARKPGSDERGQVP